MALDDAGGMRMPRSPGGLVTGLLTRADGLGFFTPPDLVEGFLLLTITCLLTPDAEVLLYPALAYAFEVTLDCCYYY